MKNKYRISTNKFEQIAKNAVINVMKEKYGVNINFDNLEFVWFSHELGYKKCTLYSPELNDYYPEVTYNLAKDEMYIDVYEKQFNTCIDVKDLMCE